MLLLHAAAKEGEERIPAGIIKLILFVCTLFLFFWGAEHSLPAVNLFVGISFYYFIHSLFFFFILRFYFQQIKS